MPSVARISCVVAALLALVLSVDLPAVAALIPRECARNATRPPGVCCPTPPGSSVPCGGPGVGACRRVRTYEEVHMYDEHRETWLHDPRARWPSRVFSFLCECQGARFGVACQECWFGRTGPSCTSPAAPLLRRNVMLLSGKERLLLRGVLSLSRRLTSDFVVPTAEAGRFRNVSVHEALVFQHFFASRRTRLGGRCRQLFDCNHEGPAFPSWHRLFLLQWERALGRIAEEYFGVTGFAVPYWDWTDEKGCAPCVDDLVGDLASPSSSSFLRRWPVFCPGAGCEECEEGRPRLLARDTRRLRLPTSAQLLSTLRRRVFFALDDTTLLASDVKCPSFARYFEGNCADAVILSNFTMHNAVHRSVVGPMNESRTSPNDPLFLLHHSQVDRVLHAWVRARRPTSHDIPNTRTPPGQCRDCFLVGLLPPVRNADMLVDLEALGVRYDGLVFGKTDLSNLTRS